MLAKSASLDRDIKLLYASQALGVALAFVNSIVISRALGPADRGVYFLLVTVNYLIVNLGSLGVSFTNTYLLAKQKYPLREVNANSMMFSLGLGGVSLGLYLALRPVLHEGFLKGVDPAFALAAVLLVPFELYKQYWSCMMAGQKRFFLVTVVGCIGGVFVTLATLLILLVWKGGIAGLMGLWAAGSIIITLLYLVVVSRADGLTLRWNSVLFKEALRFGLSGHLGSMVGHVMIRLDMFVVNYFTGVAGVGHYSLAKVLTEKMYLLVNPIIQAANPRIIEKAQEASALLMERVLRSVLFILIVAGIAAVAVGPWMIPFLYGAEYRPAIVPFLVLIPALTFRVVAEFVSGSYITGQLGKPYVSSLFAWLVLALYLPALLLLTRHYGFTGAALAAVISYLADSVLCVAFYGRVSRMPLARLLTIRWSEIMDTRQRLVSWFRVEPTAPLRNPESE